MGDDRSSFNTELASISLEEEILELDLLERLDSEDLCELRKYFFSLDTESKKKAVHRKQQRQKKPKQIKGEDVQKYGGRPLKRKQFVTAVEEVVGNPLYSPSAGRWFDSLDTSKMGLVWWEEVLDDIIDKMGSCCAGGPVSPVDTHIEIFNIPHCKRETIVKVVPVATQTTFCYALVTKFGRVGVYDGSLQLLDSYIIALSEGGIRERIGDTNVVERRRRVTSIWLTDAIHFPDANVLLLACSDRSLHIYNASILIHAPLFVVKGMRHVPQCLAYAVARGENPSMLFIGDSAGNVTTLRFHQPRVSLFRKKHPEQLDKYYWMELDQHSSYVDVTTDMAVHADAVRQVAYFPENETVVTCSRDPSATLVIRHVAARRTPYILKLARGVRCFHLERSMRLLATGSNDCVVRLWNPVVTKQPLMSLFGHKAAIVDVLILRHLDVVVSFAQDGVLKVWDADDQCCVQTLPLSFPSFNVLGKVVEFGTRSLYPGPSSGATPTPSGSGEAAEPDVWQRDQLLVACCDCVAVLRVQASRDRVTPPPLPPPSREHRASVPSPWTAADARGIITPELPLSLQQSDSRRSSRSSDITPPRDAQSLHRAASLHGLNVLRTRHEREQQKMKPLVLQGAPHLTLQLWDLHDIQFSRELPLTRRMRDRRLDLSNADKVVAARLPSTPRSSSRTSSNATSVRSGVSTQLTVPFPGNRKSKSPRQ